MSVSLWLLVGVIVFPALWGALVHWAAARLWPPHRRRAVRWTEPAGSKPNAGFLDYQI